MDSFLFPEASSLAAELDRSTSPGFRRLNAAVAQLVDEWSMVAFAALDYSDEESIGDVLAQIDHCIQVGQARARTLKASPIIFLYMFLQLAQVNPMHSGGA